MLMLDSHWMPFATPDTAESTNAAVSTAMMPTRRRLPVTPMPPTISRPLRICSAPSPSEAAEPKSVAKIASMSITLPAAPVRTAAEERLEGGADRAATRPLR